MRKNKDFEHLRYCLNNCKPDYFFVRMIGSCGGAVKVREKLENKIFDFEKKLSGLSFFVNTRNVIKFPLRDYEKGFSVEPQPMDRNILGKFRSGTPKMHRDNIILNSFVLRSVFDNHLAEIYFKGNVSLETDGWLRKPYFHYWKIKK